MAKDGMKRCNKCGQLLPATPEFFHRNATRGDGLRYICKTCAIASTREYQMKNRDKWNGYMRNYRKKNNAENK